MHTGIGKADRLAMRVPENDEILSQHGQLEGLVLELFRQDGRVPEIDIHAMSPSANPFATPRAACLSRLCACGDMSLDTRPA